MSDSTGPNIALRAYHLWDAAGRPEGRAEEFYYQAEEEFRRLLDLLSSPDGIDKEQTRER